MLRRAALVSALCAAASIVTAAAGVWDTKPFTEWSDKDVEKVTTDSPWAGKASITHARQGANLGTVPDWDLIVSMRSGLPYRQALVRRQIGAGGTVTPELSAALAAGEPGYIFAISGIPRLFQMQAVSIASAMQLKRPGKPVMKGVEARVLMFDKDGKQLEQNEPPSRQGGLPAGGGTSQPGGALPGGGFGRGASGGFGEDKSGITMTILVAFPKADAITLADDELELTTTIGTYNVKKTFKLKDMQVKGQLAL